jgi:hypothetical protein
MFGWTFKMFPLKDLKKRPGWHSMSFVCSYIFLKEKGRKWFKSGIDETEIEKRPSKPRRVVVFVKRLRIIEKKIHDGSNSNRSRIPCISRETVVLV